VDYTVNVIEALIGIGGIIGIVAVGLFVSGRMTKWWSSALYALLTASLATLMVSGYYALEVSHTIAMLWYARFCALSVVVATVCLYFLVQELVDSSKSNRLDRTINITVFWTALTAFVLSLTPAVFSGVYFVSDRNLIIDADWGAIFLVFFIASVVVLIGFRFVEQARTAYGRRHGVLDLRFVAVRTISYLFSLIAVAICFVTLGFVSSYFFMQLSGSELDTTVLGPIAIVSALVAALALQPIKKLFNKAIDRLLYKDNYSINEFTVRMSQTLNSTNDLRTLLERSAKVIASTVKSSQAFFFVNLLEDRHMSAGTEGHSKVGAAEFKGIERVPGRQYGPLLISQFPTDHALHRMMMSHRLDLVMPLCKGEEIVGFLCLGRSKKVGYTNRDIKVLRMISDELTIAIQNALSVDEVRKLNDTLEQRISSATRELRTSNAQLQRLDEVKDEFISMASHQLRTPLTSIKGYISMMLEGDVGKITKEQRHMLSEAFVSSERMVRLIGDFLNVSRLQTGRFVIDKHPVDLALLVQREVDGLTQNALARGIKFTYKKPKNIPLLELDENKIQQVIMNFSDNAIYYSKEKSTVTVSLEKIGDFIEFKVVDTGIGVPKKEQDQLFGKFFRASNARQARPDGTGVGLFLAKKVIDDHDGIILFESKEGEGSTFGFRLPAPR
jgi:signal transduction histidine kinase